MTVEHVYDEQAMTPSGSTCTHLRVTSSCGRMGTSRRLIPASSRKRTMKRDLEVWLYL